MGFTLISLLLSLHVLGDFYLQSEKTAEYKKICYRGVIVHSVQYGIPCLLALVFVRFSLLLAVCLILSALFHWGIDSLKYWMSKRPEYSSHFSKPARIFLADQLLHLILLLLVALLYVKAAHREPMLYLYDIWNELLMLINLTPMSGIKWLLVLLVVIKPANIIFNLFFSAFNPERETAGDARQQRAGAIIGSLERILIVFFISIGQYSALGFILTAKSIARYDAIAKDRKFAEYYLIGTLVSVVLSVIAHTVVFYGI
ncbi:hypothetical protein CLHUN_36780 [Ruminiclostridium hungatei]|uniref:DUF3307 domain-containing protein n=1 Tax=Ruminiclostridium hungatei TaxID=48256 RepID=A0A1V4SGK5_RUMHU|nr:DUF3307 domain-containing protein [Ruminiclostridium hungatei]OPX42381.1 hypothetical protein CLHUN_36780 [Ruminiclostridium hungatei]